MPKLHELLAVQEPLKGQSTKVLTDLKGTLANIPGTISETLFAAADLLERGWITGIRYNPDYTKFCAIGAIEHVLHGRESSRGYSLSASRAINFIADQLFGGGESCSVESLGSDSFDLQRRADFQLAAWNNTGTQEQVVSGFRRAAMVAEVLNK
jgi:hypothetical protein